MYLIPMKLEQVSGQEGTDVYCVFDLIDQCGTRSQNTIEGNDPDS